MGGSVPASRATCPLGTAGGAWPRNGDHGGPGVADELLRRSAGVGRANGGAKGGSWILGRPCTGVGRAPGGVNRATACAFRDGLFGLASGAAGPATSPVGRQRSETPRGGKSATFDRSGAGAGRRSGTLPWPHPIRTQLSLAKPTGPQAATARAPRDGSKVGRATSDHVMPWSTVSNPPPLPAHAKPNLPEMTVCSTLRDSAPRVTLPSSVISAPRISSPPIRGTRAHAPRTPGSCSSTPSSQYAFATAPARSPNDSGTASNVAPRDTKSVPLVVRVGGETNTTRPSRSTTGRTTRSSRITTARGSGPSWSTIGDLTCLSAPDGANTQYASLPPLVAAASRAHEPRTTRPPLPLATISRGVAKRTTSRNSNDGSP